MEALVGLDDPSRAPELRATIQGKPLLRDWYLGIYRKYQACLDRCPREGKAIELGSGAGFAKELIPELVTTDTLSYPGVDLQVDARKMQFADQSLRAIFLLNVFHHIPDCEAFLAEAERCLMPGGRLLIVDQHKGWLSEPILRYAHHEPYLPRAGSWTFESTGALSGANGALAWIVFQRDLKKFQGKFPGLRFEGYRPFSPLQYWMSGGLKKWSLGGKHAVPAIRGLEWALLAVSSQFGSFVEIELTRV